MDADEQVGAEPVGGKGAKRAERLVFQDAAAAPRRIPRHRAGSFERIEPRPTSFADDYFAAGELAALEREFDDVYTRDAMCHNLERAAVELARDVFGDWKPGTSAAPVVPPAAPAGNAT